MTTGEHHTQLVETFTGLADTLVSSYDIVELLQTLVDTCAELLTISAAGVMLATPHGDLDVIASTSEACSLIELLELDAATGPSHSAFLTGKPTSYLDTRVSHNSWTPFRATAATAGYRSATVLPLRLQSTVIGTLTLLSMEPRVLTDEDLAAVRALADIATIGIIHEHNLHDRDAVMAQLHATLGSRFVIEQAKGVVAYTRGVTIDEAAARIEHHAAATGTKLSDVAHAIVDRRIHL